MTTSSTDRDDELVAKLAATHETHDEEEAQQILERLPKLDESAQVLRTAIPKRKKPKARAR